MPVDNFDDFTDTLKTYKNIYVYCNTGNSSTIFANMAQSQGVETTIVL